ncbi:MAG: FHA domain-containing protein [Alphaproteobacteria bacterium]
MQGLSVSFQMISKVCMRLALSLMVMATLLGAGLGTGPARALDLTGLNSSVVAVHVYKNGSETAVGTGTIVSDLGDILTSSTLIAGADQIKVSNPGGTSTLAALHRENRLLDIAVISAPGLDIAIPATIAQGGAAPGGGIFAVTAMTVNGQAGTLSSAPGVMGDMSQSSDGAMISSHSAAVPESGLGAPLVNGCGEILSMNRAAGAGNQAAMFQDIVSFMNAAGVDMRQTTSVCSIGVNTAGTAAPVAQAPATQNMGQDPAAQYPTAQPPAAPQVTGSQTVDPAMEAAMNAARDARVDAQFARQQANSAEQAARQAEAVLQNIAASGADTTGAEAAATAAREQASAAAAYAVQLEQIANQKDAQVAAMRGELQAAGAERTVGQEQAADKQQMMQILVGVGALIAIAVIGFVLFRVIKGRQSTAEMQEELTAVRRRTPRTDHAAAAASGGNNTPDVVLSGLDSENQPLKVTVSGKDLAAKSSIIVGRSPSHADVLINDVEMSRAHAAIRVSSSGYMIEDMGSTNGTMVNGAPAGQGSPVQIRDGDSVFFGSVKLKVEIL